MGKISKALEKSGYEDSTVENESEIEKYHLDPVIQTDSGKENDNLVPASPNQSKPFSADQIPPMLISLSEPNSIEAEQFRLLKNTLLFPENGFPPRSIMITSPSPGEGKSFVASNLAVSIAQSIDEYVLLIDCDLRKPTIHSNFGLSNTHGLSEHLTRAEPLSKLMVKTFVNKLTLLPAGRIPDNPSELLSSEQMRRLIKEVTKRYTDRYIIIDAPPPYLTSEAGALARQVDGIVIVIRQGRTRKKDVENMIEMYGKDKILGVVYNFAKKMPGYKSGYYKYGYGR